MGSEFRSPGTKCLRNLVQPAAEGLGSGFRGLEIRVYRFRVLGLGSMGRGLSV